jgi:hypothetical protein
LKQDTGFCYPVPAWDNAQAMPLKTLHTLAQNKPFEYKRVDHEEIIVYPAISKRQHALAITAYEEQLVKDRIKQAGRIAVGASRDNPPPGTLGEVVKTHGGSPQILSYLCAILVAEGFCTASKDGNTTELVFTAKPQTAKP